MDKIALSLNIIKNDNDSHMYAFIIMLTDVIADIMPRHIHSSLSLLLIHFREENWKFRKIKR